MRVPLFVAPFGDLDHAVQRGDVLNHEAQRILVWWYPLPDTDTELAQEENEENASVDTDEDMQMFRDEWGDRSS